MGVPCSSIEQARIGLRPSVLDLRGDVVDDALEVGALVVGVRQEFNIAYLGRVTGGTITSSHESAEVRFIDPTEFDRIPSHDTVRLRLRRHAEHRSTPYLG
jgi:hypothetical protein